jgi:flagellar basal-body rod protein FlgC
MIPALSTALSGMQAATARLAASASNVANVRSTGPLPGPGLAPADGRRAYVPVDVVQRSDPTGGVATAYAPRRPAHGPGYAPGSPDADERGLVAAPNVDLAAEAVSQIEALLAFKANAAVARAVDRMTESTLDLTA